MGRMPHSRIVAKISITPYYRVKSNSATGDGSHVHSRAKGDGWHSLHNCPEVTPISCHQNSRTHVNSITSIFYISINLFDSTKDSECLTLVWDSRWQCCSFPMVNLLPRHASQSLSSQVFVHMQQPDPCCNELFSTLVLNT